jgi:hypothetical protein
VELWDGTGQVVGRGQGAVDALQAILARGRDQTMWNDVISRYGHSVYLVNPVGWFLTDSIEINLHDERLTAPEVIDYRRNRGLEVYSHGYIGTAESQSRDGQQALMFAKFSPSGSKGTGSADLKAAEGHHRGTTHAESAVSEQTTYDWAGHYIVRYRHRLNVRVRHLKMSGRPLNNLLLTAFKRIGNDKYDHSLHFDGTMDIQVPHALAESGTLFGPRQVRNVLPLPKVKVSRRLRGLDLR